MEHSERSSLEAGSSAYGYSSFPGESIDVTESFSALRSRLKIPHAKASWATAGQIMIADIVGVGVLTLATAMADLGWIAGTAAIILFFPLNLYTGMLLWKVKLVYPRSVSYFDMARYLYPESKGMKKLVAFIVYAHIFLTLGDYILVLGQSLGLIFFDVHICKPWWILMSCLLIIPVTQLRLLSDAEWLCWVNMLSISLAVAIALGYLLTIGVEESRGPGSVVELVPADLSLLSFARALPKIAFAYGRRHPHSCHMAPSRTANLRAALGRVISPC